MNMPTEPVTWSPEPAPSSEPTGIPTSTPSGVPTAMPSSQPTLTPSRIPSLSPSIQQAADDDHPNQALPSSQPTLPPSRIPSLSPSIQQAADDDHPNQALPTVQPSQSPSTAPSLSPTNSITLNISLFTSSGEEVDFNVGADYIEYSFEGPDSFCDLMTFEVECTDPNQCATLRTSILIFQSANLSTVRKFSLGIVFNPSEYPAYANNSPATSYFFDAVSSEIPLPFPTSSSLTFAKLFFLVLRFLSSSVYRCKCQ
jgi:hypothetical protein